MEFTFIRHGRHGNTNKSENDLDRNLTELGKKQATDRRKSLEKKFDFVISSPAVRARQTAEIVANINIYDVIPCNELYFSTNNSDKEAMDKLFSELGYSPLRKYLERDVELFNRYGRCAHDAVWNRIADNHKIENVLIVGHAILLNATAGCFSSDPFIADCRLGECEGLYIGDGNVVHIK